MYIVVLVVVVAGISTHYSMYLKLTLGSTKEMAQLQSKVVQQKDIPHRSWRVCVVLCVLRSVFSPSTLLPPLAGLSGELELTCGTEFQTRVTNRLTRQSIGLRLSPCRWSSHTGYNASM
jgi:hypothetical protein